MSAPIRDLEHFSPNGQFLQELIDVSADAVTLKATGQTVSGEEKAEQRQVFIGMTARMACMKGKGVVNTILGELDSVETHRDFLNAMKRIEPLLRRVRDKLSQLQILVPSRDALSVLQFRQPLTQKPVSALQKLTRTEQVKESELAVEFINTVLPHLSKKMNEVNEGAYTLGDSIHRDDYDFTGVGYGGPSILTSDDTSVEKRRWRGVQLPPRSEYGLKLMKLSQEQQHLGKVLTFEALTVLLADDASSPLSLGALKQGLIKIDHLFEQAGVALPYEKVYGQGIRFPLEAGAVVYESTNTETADFIPNADFLDQPIELSSKKETASVSEQELTVEDIETLGLSENAAKILRYMMENTTGNIVKIADVIRESGLGALVAAQITTIRDEINHALAGRTEKRIMVAGTNIGFAVTQ